MNCKPSTLKDHENTEIHKRAVQEKEIEDESKSGLHIKQKVIEQHIPKNPPLVKGFQSFQAEEDTLVKLQDIVYYIALRNNSFMEFKNFIELKEIHRMSYSLRKHINEMGCWNIIQNDSFCLFDRDIALKNGKLTLSLYYAMAQEMLTLLNTRRYTSCFLPWSVETSDITLWSCCFRQQPKCNLHKKCHYRCV